VSELPENWTATTLGEISLLEMGQSPDGDATNVTGSGYPLVGGASEFKCGGLTATRFTDQPTKLSEIGDIILCIRATIGKVAVADKIYCLGRGVAGIRPQLVDSDWLRRFLVYSGQALDEAGTGTTFRQIDKATLNNWPLGLPPLPEQRRIVAKLDALLAGVARARKELDRVPSLIAHHKQALLAAAFSGELTREWRGEHPEVWQGARRLHRRTVRRGVPETAHAQDFLHDWIRPPEWRFEHVGSFLLDGSIVDVKDGNHGSNHPKRGDFGATGLPFITAAQLTDDVFNYLDAPKIEGEPLGKLKVGFAEPGDVLLSHKGTVGRAAICTQSCVLSPQTTYYRPNTESFNGAFLRYLFMSPFFQKQLRGVESQTTRNFVPILRQYQLFLLAPSLAEQEFIVRILDEGFSWLNAASAEHELAAKLLPKLEQSILAKAFRGELVPQDPADEPAAVLLARIRTERDGAARPARARKARV